MRGGPRFSVFHLFLLIGFSPDQRKLRVFLYVENNGLLRDVTPVAASI